VIGPASTKRAQELLISFSSGLAHACGILSQPYESHAHIPAPVPAAKYCKEDAIKYCNLTWLFGYKAGQVVTCLREFKSQVNKKCAKELFKAQSNVSG